MQDPYDSQEKERYQSYLKIHLKKDQFDLPLAGKIEALEKRDRTKWWHLLINFAAILFFGYSFYYDITQLGNTFLYIIMGVFIVNVGLILYQKKQINELIDFLNWKKEHEPN
jgi:amino acid transporter